MVYCNASSVFVSGSPINQFNFYHEARAQWHRPRTPSCCYSITRPGHSGTDPGRKREREREREEVGSHDTKRTTRQQTHRINSIKTPTISAKVSTTLALEPTRPPSHVAGNKYSSPIETNIQGWKTLVQQTIKMDTINAQLRDDRNVLWGKKRNAILDYGTSILQRGEI